MKIFHTIDNLQSMLKRWKIKSQTLAFVPTMGGLHAGHLALINLAQKKANRVVVSIFVNPTQFGKNEDYDKYPNTLEQDLILLKKHNIDVAFTPNVKQIYPHGDENKGGNKGNKIKIGNLGKILCGISRPGFFEGVAQVVKKFFEIVNPDIVVFGQKDYQQLLVIKNLTKQLKLNIKIISHPIVREFDGLAISTRNLYLSLSERNIAPKLYKTLYMMKENYQKINSIKKLKNQGIALLNQYFKLDYLEILDANNLDEVKKDSHEVIMLAAIYLGSTRLIDNVKFFP